MPESEEFTTAGSDAPPEEKFICRHMYWTHKGPRTLFKRVCHRPLAKQDVFLFRCSGCDIMKTRRLISKVGDGGIPIIRFKIEYPEDI